MTEMTRIEPRWNDDKALAANTTCRGHPWERIVRMHNEPLSVVAMRVSNPDCSPVGINR